MPKSTGTDFGIYKSIEFSGEGIKSISMPSRFCICNMCAEFGVKNAIFPYDIITEEYIKCKVERKFSPVYPDYDAKYIEHYIIDLDELEPYIALPGTIKNSIPVSEIENEKILIRQAFIGSCTNGRIEDFEIASKILKGKKINPNVRLIITPASQDIRKECLKRNIWDVLIDAGAIITNPTCGACGGVHLGLIGDEEVCISTSNRNVCGRMGSKKSEIYLANAATVATSALYGYIKSP